MSRMQRPARPRPRRLLDDDRGPARPRRDPAVQRLLLARSPSSAPPSTSPPATEHARCAAGWTVLVAGLLTALLTAAYATRLWLLAFRGRGAEAPDHGRQPLTMNGRAAGAARPVTRPRRPHPSCRLPARLVRRHTTSPRPSATSVLGTRPRPRRRHRHLRRLAAPAAARARRARSARSPPIPRRDARPRPRPRRPPDPRARLRRRGPRTRPRRPGTTAARPAAPPSRRRLPPRRGTCTRLLRPPGPGRRQLLSASSTARSSTPTHARRRLPRLLGAAARRAQTGNVQTYMRARCSPAPSSWSPPSSSPREREQA